MCGATGGASGSVHFNTGDAIDSTRMPRASTFARTSSISASLWSMMFLPLTTRSSANVMPRSAIAPSARSRLSGENSSVIAPISKMGSGGFFSVHAMRKTAPDPFSYLIGAGSSRGESRCTISSATRYADAAMMNTGR